MRRAVYDLGALTSSLVQIRVPDARMFTSDAPRGAVVSIEIDWNRIAKQLAPRALRAKGRKAQVLSGAVKVKLLEELPCP